MATLYFKVNADFQAVKDLRNEIDRLEKKLRSARMGDSIKELTNRLREAKREFDSIVSAAARTGRAVTELAANMNTVRDSSRGAASAVGDGLSSATRRAEGHQRRFSTSLRETHRTMSELRNSTQGATMDMGNFVKNFTLASVAVGAFHKAVNMIKGSFDTITGFEAANATLQAIMGESADGLQQLRDKALELGRTTVFTASQVTQLETELAKLGFTKQEILDMSNGVLSLAQSTGSDLANAATTAGAALRMFGADASESSKYAAAMSAATRMSALDFRAISDNLATFGPMAKSMGMGIEDVLALFGKLRDQGIEASTAMTSLRNIFTKVSQGKIEGLADVNSLDDFVAGLQKAKDALGGDVGKAMKMIGPRGGTQFMSLLTAFDKQEFDENSNQMVDSITHLRNRIRAEMGNTEGLDEMADTMNNNVAGSIAMCKSAWEGFILSFSNSTGPIKGVIDTVTKTIGKMTEILDGDSIDPSAFVAAANAIEFLIGTLAAYKVVSMGQKTVNDALYASYEKQAMELTKLQGISYKGLSADLERQVAARKLTNSQAQLIMEFRKRIKTEQELTSKEMQGISADIQAIDAMMAEASAEDKVVLAKQRDLALTKQATLLKKQEALAHLQNADAENVEAGTLKRMLSSLKSSMSSFLNTTTLVSAAIGGAIMLLMEFATKEGLAEHAQNAVNEALERQNQLLDEYRGKAQGFLSTMMDEKVAMQERYKAYKDFIELYKEFERYSFDNIMAMSPEKINTLMYESEANKMKEMNEQRKAVYADILSRYGYDENGEKGLDFMTQNNSAGFSIKESELKEILKKNGIEDKEVIQSYLDELNDISNVDADIDHYVEAMKAYNKELGKMAKDDALDMVALSLMRIGKQTDTNTKVSSEYFDILIKNAENIKNMTAKADVEKQLANLDAIRATLEATKLGATEEEKIKIVGQLEDVEGAIEIYKELKKAMDSGNNELVEKILIEIEGEGDVDLSGKTAKDLADAYDAAELSATSYSAALEKAERENVSLEEAFKSMGHSQKEMDKYVQDAYTAASKKVDELTKKLKDGTLTKREKKQIEIDLAGAQKAKVDIKDIMDDIERAKKDTHTITIIADIKTQFDDKSFEALINLPIFDDEYRKKMKKWYYDMLSAKSRGDEISVNARKAREASDPDTPAQTDEPTTGGGGKNDGRRDKIRQAEKSFNDALLKLQEQYEKQRLDLIRKAEDEELKTMADGSNKQLAEMKKRHARELEDLAKRREDMTKQRDEQAESLWDKGQAVAAAKGEKGYVKREWDELSDKEKAEFATKNNINLNLTDNELETFERETDAVLKRQQKDIEDFYAKQRQVLVKFLQDFGDVEQRRAAIAEEYEAKVQKAIAGGDYTEANRAAIEGQRKIEQFDFEQMKKDLNWDDVFNNLQYKSIEALKNIRAELERLLSVGDISAENAKIITEQMAKIDAQIRERGNVWREMLGKSAIGSIFEMRDMRQKATAANNNYNSAREDAMNKRLDVSMSEKLLRTRMQNAGISTKDSKGNELNLLDEENQKKILDSVKGTESAGWLGQSFTDLMKKRSKSNDADERERDAKRKADDASQNAFGMDMSKGMGIASMVNANVQSMNHLNETLGLDDTGFAEKVGQFAEASQSAMNAMQSFMSGDFVGAAASAIDSIMSIGKLFGATYGNMEAMNEEIERLSDTNMALISALGDLEEALQNSTILEASENYAKAVRVFEAAQKNSSQIMIDEARKWEKGSHSIGSQLNDSGNFANLMQQAGVKGGAYGFLSLSAKEMKEIRDNNTDLYNEILQSFRDAENAHTGEGIDEMIEQFIQDYADGMDRLNQKLQEKMTGISFDGLYDNWISMLKDMSTSAEDFADDIQKKLNDIVIEDIGATLKEDLKAAHQELTDEMNANGGVITKDMEEKYRQQVKDVTDKALQERQAMIDAGILSQSNIDQNFSKSGVGNMTEDQAEEMNGRLTMIQVTADSSRRELGAQTILLTSIRNGIDQLADSKFDVSPILEQMASSYIELKEINANTKNTANTLSTMAADISEIKNNTSKL